LKKKLEPKIDTLDCRLGLAKVGHKNAETLPLVTTPTENLKPKIQTFFSPT